MENKKSKIRVYIASPYRADREKCVQLQMDAYYELIKLGFNPFMPTYNHFVQLQHPDIDTPDFPWLDFDVEWLEMCDIAVRLHPKDIKGNEIPSPGADFEQDFCEKKGIPMFHFDDIPEMIRWLQTFKLEK